MLAILQRKDGVSGAELAAALGTTTRTVRGDAARLRALGYEVRAKSGPEGHYRLGPGDRLPPLVLDDDEAVAVAVGLTAVAGTVDPASPIAGGAFDAAAGRILGVVERLLPDRLRRRTATEVARIAPQLRQPVELPEGLLVAVTRAIAEHRLLHYASETPDHIRGIGIFEPYRLLYEYPGWYMAGLDRTPRRWMARPLDDITAFALAPTSLGPLPIPPLEADLRAHIDGRWHEATLSVRSAQTALEEALRFHDAEVESHGPDEHTVRVRRFAFDALLMRLVLHGVEFTVLDPPDAAQRCATLAAAMGRAAGA